MRGQALVDEFHRQIETAVQALAETPGQPPGFVHGAVIVTGDTHHQQHGLPFSQQCSDFGETGVVVLGGDDRQRMRNAQADFTGGDADPLFAEIESQYCALRRSRIHAWPATSDRLA